MLKNIIVLALCFMAYIIGNIDALRPSERSSQYNRFVTCYKQMFENGLIKPIPDIQNGGKFQDILKNFYKQNSLSTYDHSEGTLELMFGSGCFQDDESFNSFKDKFTNQFEEHLNPEDLKKKLDGMISELDVVLNYPLGVFAKNYVHNSPQEMLRSVKAYCNAYSIFIEAENKKKY